MIAIKHKIALKKSVNNDLQQYTTIITLINIPLSYFHQVNAT